MCNLVLSWLDDEVLERPITSHNWGQFMLVLREMQEHNEHGMVSWGLCTKLDDEKCFGTVVDGVLRFVNTERDGLPVVVDHAQHLLTTDGELNYSLQYQVSKHAPLPTDVLKPPLNTAVARRRRCSMPSKP